jgi:hypothetical protein
VVGSFFFFVVENILGSNFVYQLPSSFRMGGIYERKWLLLAWYATRNEILKIFTCI